VLQYVLASVPPNGSSVTVGANGRRNGHNLPAMHQRTFRALVPLAVAAALALPAAASATIVPQARIAGVGIDSSSAKVKAALGTPARVEHGKNDFGPYTIFHYPGYRVIFQGNGGVTQIETTLPKEKTASGVGVGSTRAEVKAGVPGVRCEGPAPGGHCYLGSFTAGERVTDFFLANGRVRQVILGIVID